MSIRDDILANKGNLKSIFFILCFRLSHFFTTNSFLRLIGFPWRIYYKILSEWIYHLEIKDTTIIGKGFQIYHGGHGTVIGPSVIIGNYVSIRHNTTIGGKGFKGEGKRPVIGDNVSIGPSCTIIGAINIGDNSEIGAGSVVTKDVKPNEIVAGNPARVIRIKMPF